MAMDNEVEERIRSILLNANKPLDKYGVYIRLGRLKGKTDLRQVGRWLNSHAERARDSRGRPLKGSYNANLYIKKDEWKNNGRSNSSAGFWMTKTSEPWE